MKKKLFQIGFILLLAIFEMKNIKDKRICQSKVGEQAGFSDVAYLYG